MKGLDKMTDGELADWAGQSMSKTREAWLAGKGEPRVFDDLVRSAWGKYREWQDNAAYQEMLRNARIAGVKLHDIRVPFLPVAVALLGIGRINSVFLGIPADTPPPEKPTGAAFHRILERVKWDAKRITKRWLEREAEDLARKCENRG